MFGAYRFLLALFVAIHHFWFWALPSSASYAVFAFYVLAGYLMVRVIRRDYSDGLSGFGRFLANRALRIYPAYLASMAISAAIVIAAPAAALTVHKVMFMPTEPAEVVAQFTIIGTLHSSARILPTSWSLDIELIHYLLIGAIFARSRWLTNAWLVASVGYILYLDLTGAPWTVKYTTYAGTSVCFAAGACLAHYLDHSRSVSRLQAFGSVTAFAAFTIASGIVMRHGAHDGVYVAAALAVCATAGLARLSKGRIPGWFLRADDYLGLLAYPLFLLHWTGGAIATVLLGYRPPPPVLCIAAVLIAVSLSALIVALVEIPLQDIRARIRLAKARAAPATL